MCTPFCPTDEWRVAARLHKGVVYLRNIVLETEKERFSKELQGSKPPGWNGSFHRRMTTNEQGAAPQEGPIDETQTFHTVLRANLGSHRIVFEAEVMAVCPSPESKEGPLYQYVEFRARQDFDGSLKKENFYRYKLQKWWTHSRLAGVPYILVGSYNEKDVFEYVTKLDVSEIPTMHRHHWSENKCFRFCDQVLSFVKKQLQNNDERVLIFDRLNEENIQGKRIISCKPGDKYAVLPYWYVHEIYDVIASS
ncbi:decapping and exoribonuclease protein-like [Rhipicephalus sanguineus]|uniref:decapping and exoribonuclease protein-like n=1 Tax=Rhipicephalus sanguineus TaxID=34632 RepID=UPI001895A52D|nr:decapping and exoribonuclease protein-like [Rhipicephalus sanguineus]